MYVHCTMYILYNVQSTVVLYYAVWTTLLTKITAVQNKVAQSYHRVRGLCFLAVIFAVTICTIGSRSTVHIIHTVS